MVNIIEDIDGIEEVGAVDGEKSIMDYAQEMIGYKVQIKTIQDSIKELKKDAKSDGVLVKEIDSAIASITRDLKLSPLDRELQESIRQTIEEDEALMAEISILV